MIHTVVGIIKKENKVLVAERPLHKPYSGYWEFPGGKVEKTESPQAALTRELQEELGITVLTAKPWFQHTHSYPDKTVFLDIWLVQDFLGIPQGKENQCLRWVNFSELLALKLLEGNRTIIDKISELFPVNSI